MGWTSSKCFLCGDQMIHHFRFFLPTSEKIELLKRWTRSWALSLCDILELDHSYETAFEEARFCSKCQQTVCNAEFTTTSISRLQRELSNIKGKIKTRLLRNYKTIVQHQSLAAIDTDAILFDSHDQSIENIIRTIQIKGEPEDMEESVDDEEENEYILPTLLPLQKEEYKSTSCTSFSKYDSRRKQSYIPLFSRSGRRITSALPEEADSDSDRKNYSEGDENESDDDNQIQPIDSDSDFKYSKDDADTLNNSSVTLTCNLNECLPKRLTFHQPRDIREHILKEHNGIGLETIYHCSHCELRFKKYEYLRLHTFRKHNHRTKLRCTTPKCIKVFYTPKDLRTHLRKKHELVKGVEKFHCKLCQREFNSCEEVGPHEDLHLDETPFDCVLCSEKFTDAESLGVHVRDMHDLKTLRCTQTEACRQENIAYEGLRQIQKHINSDHGSLNVGTPYHCPRCCRQYNRPYLLHFHSLKGHGGKPTVPCSKCTKKFYTVGHVKSHLWEAHDSNKALSASKRKSGKLNTTKRGAIRRKKEDKNSRPKKRPRLDVLIKPLLTPLSEGCSPKKEETTIFSRSGRRIKPIVTKKSDSDEGDDEIIDPDTNYEHQDDKNSDDDELTDKEFGRVLSLRNKKVRKRVVYVSKFKSNFFDCNTVNIKLTCNYDECKEKSLSFTRPPDVKRHLMTAHDGKGDLTTLFHCKQCPHRSKKYERLEHHIIKTHMANQEQPKFRCPDCNHIFLTRRYRQAHQRYRCVGLKHLSKSAKCKICEMNLKIEELTAHEALHTESNCHDCVLCDEKFSQSPDLLAHVQKVHNVSEPQKIVYSTLGKLKNKPQKKKKSSYQPRRKYKPRKKGKFEVIITPVSDELNLTCNLEPCRKIRLTFESELEMKEHLTKSHDGVGKEKPYHCPRCISQFENDSDWKSHVAKIHGNRNMVPCPVCEKLFLTITSMERHLEKVHELNLEESQKCSVCWKYCVTTEMLKEHEERHKEGQLTCVVCVGSGKTFSHVGDLIEHVQSDHEARPFLCNFPRCLETHKAFRSGAEMRDHLRDEHEFKEWGQIEQVYHCPLCETRFRRSTGLDIHRARMHHDGTPQFFCHLCGKGFFTNHNLKKHVKDFHTTLQMRPKCKFCTKSFDAMAAVEEHEKLHQDKSPFVCVLCEEVVGSTLELHSHVLNNHEELEFKCKDEGCTMAFDTRPKLEWHRKSKHKVFDKPHQCPHCPFRFHMPSGLRSHMFCHTTEKNFACPVEGCGLSFVWKNKRNAHVREVHNIGKLASYDCKICGKTFSSKSKLQFHEVHHTAIRPFMCEICSATFKTPRNLCTHRKVHLKTSGTNIKLQRPRRARIAQVHTIVQAPEPSSPQGQPHSSDSDAFEDEESPGKIEQTSPAESMILHPPAVDFQGVRRTNYWMV